MSAVAARLEPPPLRNRSAMASASAPRTPASGAATIGLVRSQVQALLNAVDLPICDSPMKPTRYFLRVNLA